MLAEQFLESYENDNVIYEHVNLGDFDFVKEINTFFYPCPCGDIFEITLDALLNGETICKCPSCSLTIQILYNKEDLKKYVNV